MDESILEAIVRASFIALGFSSPNPPVASVITNTKNEIIATGFTQITGSNHAERQAYANLEKLKSTQETIDHNLFVTLEPCTHFGRTPPCRDLIIEKKPKTIFIGALDPNPMVSHLRDDEVYTKAGIECKMSKELLTVGHSFLSGFFQRVKKNRPKIIIKSAITQDCFYSGHPPTQIAISCPESNIGLSMLRAKVDAIIVGPKTVSIDEPSLNFRMSQAKDTFATEDKNSLNQGKRVSTHHPLVMDKQFIENKQFSFDNHHHLFWQSLLLFAKDNEISKFHKDHILDYQPIRIFILDQGRQIAESFIQKQINIQKQYASKTKVLFYILFDRKSNQSNEQSKQDYSKLSSIPESFVKKLPEDHWADFILRDLSELGVNTLLVEGGNLLYSEFGKLLEEEDEILLVQNKNLTLGSGSKFSLDLKSKELVFQTSIGSDEWKVYKGK